MVVPIPVRKRRTGHGWFLLLSPPDADGWLPSSFWRMIWMPIPPGVHPLLDPFLVVPVMFYRPHVCRGYCTTVPWPNLVRGSVRSVLGPLGQWPWRRVVWCVWDRHGRVRDCSVSSDGTIRYPDDDWTCPHGHIERPFASSNQVEGGVINERLSE